MQELAARLNADQVLTLYAIAVTGAIAILVFFASLVGNLLVERLKERHTLKREWRSSMTGFVRTLDQKVTSAYTATSFLFLRRLSEIDGAAVHVQGLWKTIRRRSLDFPVGWSRLLTEIATHLDRVLDLLEEARLSDTEVDDEKRGQARALFDKEVWPRYVRMKRKLYMFFHGKSLIVRLRLRQLAFTPAPPPGPTQQKVRRAPTGHNRSTKS